MPAFQPAASPSFARSSSVASGKRSRTSSSVPSVEPWSTTTVSCPRTLPRLRSTHGSAFSVTTIAVTSSAIRDRVPRRPSQSFPREDDAPRHRHEQRDEEEQEARGERRVRVDADGAEEADEERLPHGEAVDRERDQQHEEEHRA